MRSPENKELETDTTHSPISRTHPYIYIYINTHTQMGFFYTHTHTYIYMKDKGAEFPKKPCV